MDIRPDQHYAGNWTKVRCPLCLFDGPAVPIFAPAHHEEAAAQATQNGSPPEERCQEPFAPLHQYDAAHRAWIAIG